MGEVGSPSSERNLEATTLMLVRDEGCSLVAGVAAGVDPPLVAGNEKLLSAAAAGNIYTIQSILSRRPGTRASYADRGGKTALHVAARQGHTMVVKWLIKEGSSDVNAPTHDADTPLHYAALSKSVEMVNLRPTRWMAKWSIAFTTARSSISVVE